MATLRNKVLQIVAPKGAGLVPADRAALNPRLFEVLSSIRTQQNAKTYLGRFCTVGSRPSRTRKAATSSSTSRQLTKNPYQKSQFGPAPLFTDGGAFKGESKTSSGQALPIRTPAANTSAPPRITCNADMTKLMRK
jgi:hypothetical protein